MKNGSSRNSQNTENWNLTSEVSRDKFGSSIKI